MLRQRKNNKFISSAVGLVRLNSTKQPDATSWGPIHCNGLLQTRSVKKIQDYKQKRVCALDNMTHTFSRKNCINSYSGTTKEIVIYEGAEEMKAAANRGDYDLPKPDLSSEKIII